MLSDQVMGEPIFRREFDWPISNIDFNPLRLNRFAVRPGGVTVFGLEGGGCAGATSQHLDQQQDSGLDYRSDGQTLAFGATAGSSLGSGGRHGQEIPVDRRLKPFITDVSFSADACSSPLPAGTSA
ncbi:MAG: hypothetical protein IPK19_40545 [Chloroflexi bacterium]|nr:hypothetical protein [Chloroflexota bacterium]